MRLPEGVGYLPRQVRLIAKDDEGIIRINTSSDYEKNSRYEIIDHNFEQAVRPYLHGDWKDFNDLHVLSPERTLLMKERTLTSPIFYSVAKHRGMPKCPDIIVIPNLSTEKSDGEASDWKVLGCSMGHLYLGGDSNDTIQEIFEFQSYGMIVLDRGDGRPEIWVAKAGDKVTAPKGCSATLYNLGDQENAMVVLSFSNLSDNNISRALPGERGPILLAYYDQFEVVFKLNRLYARCPRNNRKSRLGPGEWWRELLSRFTERESRDPLDSLSQGAGVIVAEEKEKDRQVIIKRLGRLDLGKLLYEHLTRDPDVIGEFALLGFKIKRASPEGILLKPSFGGRPNLCFARPLAEAAKEGTHVYRYFFPDADEAEAPKPAGKGMATVMLDMARKKEEVFEEQFVNISRLKKPFTVVVEGVGDWVNKAYRDLFKDINSRIEHTQDKLNVFYADDTRWKSEKPTWVDPNDQDYLLDWEQYLDKADPVDFQRYQNIQSYADAVFIVTPDSTHCEIARSWLAYTSLIFVEKPFDSHPDNVKELLIELGRHHGKLILGLDHYQFYVWPLFDLVHDAEKHLGGALAKVVFYMTEEPQIPPGRLRSLQYGLTLDLLPHLLALLVYFGYVSTVDDVQVFQAARYDSLPDHYHNETYSYIAFTFQDYSGSDIRVPCFAVVGKGLSKEVKYMEITGSNGNAIRIDLTKAPEEGPDSIYPWSCIFFLKDPNEPVPDGARAVEITDPYFQGRDLLILQDDSRPNRFCRELDRSRYKRLIEGLLERNKTAISTTLSMVEAPEIVKSLDRIWWAVQRAKPWLKYNLGGLQPVRPEDMT